MAEAKKHSTGSTQRVKAAFIDSEMQEVFEMRMRPFRLLAQNLKKKIM